MKPSSLASILFVAVCLSGCDKPQPVGAIEQPRADGPETGEVRGERPPRFVEPATPGEQPGPGLPDKAGSPAPAQLAAAYLAKGDPDERMVVASDFPALAGSEAVPILRELLFRETDPGLQVLLIDIVNFYEEDIPARLAIYSEVIMNTARYSEEAREAAIDGLTNVNHPDATRIWRHLLASPDPDLSELARTMIEGE